MSREYDKPSSSSPDALKKLRMRYQRRPIANLGELQRALSCSGRTVFRALDKIGYRYWDESDNPAYKLFLG